MRLYGCRKFIAEARCTTAGKEFRGVVRGRALLSGFMTNLAKCMCLDLCCAQRFLCKASNSNVACPDTIGGISLGFGKPSEPFWSPSQLSRELPSRGIGQKR